MHTTRRTGLLLVGIGALALVVAALGLPHADEYVVVVYASDAPGYTGGVPYGSLPTGVQSVVRRAVNDSVSLSSFQRPALVADLRRYAGELVSYRGETYRLRVHFGAGPGHVVAVLFRNAILAAGGLAVTVGGLRYASGREPPLTLARSLLLPVGAVVAVVGMNALDVPTLRFVDWWADVVFGLFASVPSLCGVAARNGRRAFLVPGGVVAVGTTLTYAHFLAGTLVVAPLVLLGAPGFLLGYLFAGGDESDVAVDDPRRSAE